MKKFQRSTLKLLSVLLVFGMLFSTLAVIPAAAEDTYLTIADFDDVLPNTGASYTTTTDDADSGNAGQFEIASNGTVAFAAPQDGTLSGTGIRLWMKGTFYGLFFVQTSDGKFFRNLWSGGGSGADTYGNADGGIVTINYASLHYCGSDPYAGASQGSVAMTEDDIANITAFGIRHSQWGSDTVVIDSVEVINPIFPEPEQPEVAVIADFDDVDPVTGSDYTVTTDSASGNAGEFTVAPNATLSFAAPEDVTFNGSGISFWLKGSIDCCMFVHTADGKYFRTNWAGGYSATTINGGNGTVMNYPYTSFHYCGSDPYAGSSQSVALTAADIANIDSFGFRETQWGSGSTIVLDNIVVTDPIVPEPEPVDLGSMVADFDTATATVTAVNNGVFSVNTDSANSNSGNSLALVPGNDGAAGTDNTYRYAIVPDTEDINWFGDGFKFWYKGTFNGVFYVKTADGKYFQEPQNVGSSVERNSASGAWLIFNYADLKGVTSPYYGAGTGNKMTNADIKNIAEIGFFSTKWYNGGDRDPFYIDDIQIVNQREYEADPYYAPNPVDSLGVIANFDDILPNTDSSYTQTTEVGEEGYGAEFAIGSNAMINFAAPANATFNGTGIKLWIQGTFYGVFYLHTSDDKWFRNNWNGGSGADTYGIAAGGTLTLNYSSFHNCGWHPYQGASTSTGLTEDDIAKIDGFGIYCSQWQGDGKIYLDNIVTIDPVRDDKPVGIVANFDNVFGNYVVKSNSASLCTDTDKVDSGNGLKVTYGPENWIRFRAPYEGFQWYGDGIRLSLYNRLYARFYIHTTDGKYFRYGDNGGWAAYDYSAEDELNVVDIPYSSLYQASHPYTDGFSAVHPSEDDIAKIDEIGFYTSQWNSDGAEVVFDSIEVINAYYIEPKASLYGDANADNVIDVRDIVRIKKYIADNATECNTFNADMNVDQAVDADDLVLLRQYLFTSLIKEKPEYAAPVMEKGLNVCDLKTDPAIYVDIADQGFDHVRIPAYIYGENGLSVGALPTLDKVINAALDAGLTVVLDLHGVCNDLFGNVTAKAGLFYDAWETLAQRYCNYGDNLVFELINEPNSGVSGSDVIDAAKLSGMQTLAYSRIRKYSSTRTVVFASFGWNSASMLNAVVLPQADPNVAISIHTYAPMNFTHQGATWAGYSADQVHYDDNVYDAMAGEIETIAAWMEAHPGVKVWISEFGVSQKYADPDDVYMYLADFVGLCDEYDIAWCYWEYCEGFGAYNKVTQEWKENVMAGLFG